MNNAPVELRGEDRKVESRRVDPQLSLHRLQTFSEKPGTKANADLLCNYVFIA
jgi:hypothetical protein